MHFDECLGIIGEFGFYQKVVYFLICIPSIITGIHMVTSVFLLGVPKHRCKLINYTDDTYEVQNEAHERLIKAYIPTETNNDNMDVYKKCRIFSRAVTVNTTGTDSLEQDCSTWVYDQSVYRSTFAAQENLVCDKTIWTSNASMVFFAGFLVGAYALGQLSDIIGRKKALLVSVVLLLASSLSVSWTANFYLFCTLRFFVGFACAGLFMSGFVLGIEIIGPSKRMWAGIVIDYFFALGILLLCAIGYAIREWNYIEITCSVPTALLLSYWWLLSESPRWLLKRGRKEEAKEIIRRIAKRNKTQITEAQLDLLKADEESSKGKIWHLFVSKVLLIRTLVIFFNWCVVTMVYYGLSLNSGNLHGDFYLNFFLTGLVEFPAYTMCLLLLDRIGRKKLHCGCMILGGLACICTIFTVLYLDKSLQPITVTLAMLGKVGNAAAFAVIYIWSAELYPTVVRNAAMGASSAFARIGSMSSPYIADLSKIVHGNFGQALPLVVFGVASVIAGLLSLVLPETLNENLPETMEDGVNFGKAKSKYVDKKTEAKNDIFNTYM